MKRKSTENSNKHSQSPKAIKFGLQSGEKEEEGEDEQEQEQQVIVEEVEEVAEKSNSSSDNTDIEVEVFEQKPNVSIQTPTKHIVMSTKESLDTNISFTIKPKNFPHPLPSEPIDDAQICTDRPPIGPGPNDAPNVVDEDLRELKNPHIEWKMEVEEKVAILDFGAQYGKVFFNLFIKTYSVN